MKDLKTCWLRIVEDIGSLYSLSKLFVFILDQENEKIQYIQKNEMKTCWKADDFENDI